jgi:hypothetical protein
LPASGPMGVAVRSWAVGYTVGGKLGHVRMGLHGSKREAGQAGALLGR